MRSPPAPSTWGAEPLWVDESFSFALADAPLLSGPVALIASDVHPPLYFVLLGFWTRVAGYTELAGRYFSVLAGVLAVALTYALGRRLFSARAGLWAAVALSAAGLHVRYAREIRMYALLALLSAAATLAYVRWRARPTQRRALVYMGLAAALPYTHYYGALVPLAHLAHFAVTGLAARRTAHRPPWRTWLLMQGGGRACVRALAARDAAPARAAPRRHSPRRAEHAPHPGWVVTMLTDDLGWLVAGLVAAGVLGVFAVRGGQRVRAGLGVALALLWIAVPVAAAFVVNAGVPSLTARNLIAVTPALALAVGLGLSRLRALGLVAGALLVFNALTVFPYLYPGNPPGRTSCARWRRRSAPAT
ncbi:MAG: glycosyltransferase family 39 protein [Anaerolineae bacterium]|nr:glycosyltransferase family 39 protein [Anaerolineae bacterium]